MHTLSVSQSFKDMLQLSFLAIYWKIKNLNTLFTEHEVSLNLLKYYFSMFNVIH